MMRIFTCLLILFLTASAAAFSQERAGQGMAAVQHVRMLKFYPNPATTFINIDMEKPADRNLNIQLYNFLGKKILDLQAPTGRTRIDLSAYTRGIYIIQLRDRNGKLIESVKFQVEK